MVFRTIYPRHPVSQLRRELDQVLGGFRAQPVGSWLSMGRDNPPINLWETDDAVQVELEIPGVDSEHIEISVAGGELSLHVERAEAEQEGVTYHRRERPVGAFTRVIRLPADVDPNTVQAELNNGVLLIVLPKAEEAKPRKISVRAI